MLGHQAVQQQQQATAAEPTNSTIKLFVLWTIKKKRCMCVNADVVVLTVENCAPVWIWYSLYYCPENEDLQARESKETEKSKTSVIRK